MAAPIRPAVLADAPRLAEIQVAGWRSAYASFLTEEYLYTRMLVSKRIPAFEAALTSGDEEMYLVEAGPVAAGFLRVCPGREADEAGLWEIGAVYVEPAFQGRGLGCALMAYGEALGIQRGFSEAILWVFEANEASRRFYAGRGFFPDGRRGGIDFLQAPTLRYRKTLQAQARAADQSS